MGNRNHHFVLAAAEFIHDVDNSDSLAAPRFLCGLSGKSHGDTLS